MRALITGSAGLIGRHFSKYLAQRGWDVIGVDIKNGMDARKFFSTAGGTYDLVIHCAAHVGGRLDIENKAAFIGAYNVALDGLMFEWALRTRPAHVVYWSSSAAYPLELQDGQSLVTLIEYDLDVLYPDPADFTYGWAKLVGERLALEAQAEGLKVHVFRPFSGYAADQDLNYPFPSFIDRARRRDDPFDVWGDGNQVRDFIHINDIISAAMAAIDQDYLGPLNLCTGVGTSFNELQVKVCNAAGYTPNVRWDRTKPEGVRYRVGAPTEMHKVWVPKVSLEDGIKEALLGK
jgi:nucleoside-diphosphate-sugar epimerase